MSGIWTKVAAMGTLCAAATTAWGQEESPAVPSGLELTLQEAMEEPQPNGALWLRLRYVAPALTREGRADIAPDFETLCQEQAIGYMPTTGQKVDEAVISIASAPVEFGANAPDVIQFFEVFALKDGTCIWEAF